MKRMMMNMARRVLATLSWAMLLVGLPIVHAQTTGCSLSTLNGPYSVQGQGTIITQLPGFPAPPFQFAEVAVDFFDGMGNVSGKATVNLDGVVVQATVAGTYTVKATAAPLCRKCILARPQAKVLLCSGSPLSGMH